MIHELGYIDAIDFGEMNAMKYYAPPATWSDEKKRENVRNKIFSNDWYGAEKKDGYFTKIVKDDDGNVLVYSRSRSKVTGEYVDKKDWLPQLKPFFDLIPNGTCFLGELYFPSAPGSKNVTTIMQCLKDKAISRQEDGEYLHLYIFDVLAFDGTSFMTHCAEDRFDHLYDYANIYRSPYVEWALYECGQRLWVKLQTVLGQGGEGMVITHKDALYEPDKRPSKTTLKIKKELEDSIDCFFTGRTTPPTQEYTGSEIGTWRYWQDILTGEKLEGELENDYSKGRAIRPISKSYFYGFAGSLEIGVFDGDKIVPIGFLSGLTEEIRANPKKYAMQPIAVTAMEIDTSNPIPTLRHGKLINFRPDLSLSDCTLEKFINQK